MKAVFIAYNQAYNEEIIEVLERHGQRGFTRWEDIEGRGSSTGIPHMGSHAWPEMNHAILVIMEDSKVPAVLADLKATDMKSEALGLRAFTWTIDSLY